MRHEVQLRGPVSGSPYYHARWLTHRHVETAEFDANGIATRSWQGRPEWNLHQPSLTVFNFEQADHRKWTPKQICCLIDSPSFQSFPDAA